MSRSGRYHLPGSKTASSRLGIAYAQRGVRIYSDPGRSCSRSGPKEIERQESENAEIAVRLRALYAALDSAPNVGGRGRCNLTVRRKAIESLVSMRECHRIENSGAPRRTCGRTFRRKLEPDNRARVKRKRTIQCPQVPDIAGERGRNRTFNLLIKSCKS